MNRDLSLVSISLMTWGLGEGMFYFFQPLYLQELGADPLKIGSILGLVGLMMMLSYLPAGFLSDHIGRRPLIRIAWVMGSAATLLMAFAASLSMYVAGMLLYGLTSFVTVPLNSYTTAARGKLSVGRTITLVSASFNFGAILGPIIGGLVGEKAGLRANFQFAAILFVISTAVIFFIQPQPIEAKPDGSGISNLRSLLHERYLRYLLLMFFIMFGLYLPQPLTQNFLQNERGISLAVIGQLLAVRSVGIVALNLILGHLNARFGYLLAQILMGFFILFLWLGDGLPFYFAAYLLMGSYITGRGLVFAMGRTLSGAANMGVAYGLLETVMALAMVLASPLAGYLYKFNPSWIYSTSLVLIIIGIFANLALSPVHRKNLISFEEREKA